MGAGLPSYLELRADTPSPSAEVFSNKGYLWLIYVDTFDQRSPTYFNTAAGEAGVASQALEQMLTQYDYWNVDMSAKKCKRDALVFDTLGYYVDTGVGLGSTTEAYKGILVGYTAHSLLAGSIPRKLLQILGGRWCRQACLFRLTLGVFHHTFQCLFQVDSKSGPKDFLGGISGADLFEELVMCLSLLPVMTADLRMALARGLLLRRLPDGCGIMAATQLTPAGTRFLDGVAPSGRDIRHQEVGVVEGCAGIGGFEAALQMCGVRLAASLTVKNDANAKRVLDRCFPDITMT